MITASKIFSSVPPLFANLARVITGDLDCSHMALKAHGIDGSPYAVYPQAVLYPKTTADIKHALSFAREYRIPLTVCGGLTASTGGGLNEGIAIDMTRYFSHIRQLNVMENTVTVDAGATIDDLLEKLALWDMEIPVLGETLSRATVGGCVATKSASASSFFAGNIRDWIEGLTVIVDTGEEHHIRDGVTPSGRLLGIYQSVFPLLSEEGPILRASRREQSDDATGYNLWNTSIGPRQLIDEIVGSEGTLAIITSVTFRVMPRKRRSTSLVIPATARLLETYSRIAQHHRAEQLFLFDATYRKLADTFHAGLIPSSLPDSPFFLLATFRGNDEHALARQVQDFWKACPEPVDQISIEEKAKARLQSHSFLHSLFRRYFKETHMVATAGEGIIVPLRSYNECLASLDSMLGATGKLYTITGFIGSGHIAVSCALDAQSLSYEKDLEEYRESILACVSEWKGGISAVGGDGLEKTAVLPLIYNEATRGVFKKLKLAWDPLEILNPGKKQNIGKEFLMRHATRHL